MRKLEGNEMFVYVGGIPGVGKTTIIEEVLKIAHKNRFLLQGMEEKKVLCELTGVPSVKEYRLLPEEARSQARQQMISRFYELDRRDLKKIRIRDDHFTYLKEDGTFFIRPLDSKDKIQMLAFVVLIASPETILNRRLHDASNRPEPNFTELRVIANHQEIELQTAFSQAEYLKIPIRVFENKEGRILQVSQSIFSFIRECASQLQNG